MRRPLGMEAHARHPPPPRPPREMARKVVGARAFIQGSRRLGHPRRAAPPRPTQRRQGPHRTHGLRSGHPPSRQGRVPSLETGRAPRDKPEMLRPDQTGPDPTRRRREPRGRPLLRRRRAAPAQTACPPRSRRRAAAGRERRPASCARTVWARARALPRRVRPTVRSIRQSHPFDSPIHSTVPSIRQSAPFDSPIHSTVRSIRQSALLPPRALAPRPSPASAACPVHAAA